MTAMSARASEGSEGIFEQRVLATLRGLGLFLLPFENVERELELLLNGCKGRSHREIFLHLFRHGPSRFTEIKRNTTCSETQLAKSLRVMLENGIIVRDGRSYDIGLRGLRWIRDKKAKPTILLTVG
jgi:hypothetical protein